MDDDELYAHFAGIRVALAFAIKVASGGPAAINHNLAQLREIEAMIPSTLHPAVREEIEGVIAALNRMPRHIDDHHAPGASMRLEDVVGDVPKDLLR